MGMYRKIPSLDFNTQYKICEESISKMSKKYIDIAGYTRINYTQ